MLVLLLAVCVASMQTLCSNDDTVEIDKPKKEHTKAVVELMRICNENAEVRQLPWDVMTTMSPTEYGR